MKAKKAISLLVRDYSLYPRHEVDDYHVREIMEALRAGLTLPPIIADKASLRVIDGFHRIAAYGRLYGSEYVADVVLNDYESDAAMFQDAMEHNTQHGRNLTPYDKARCIARSKELGIEMQTVASALHITQDRLDKMLLERFTVSGEVLKRTTRHFAGGAITPEQSEFNRQRAGGLDQLFYINQVIGLLDSDSIDWERETVTKALERLKTLLAVKQPVATS